MKDYRNKRILIAPLNWGLGHASRCIPIINKLKEHNEVILAADGNAYDFLKIEQPDLELIRFQDVHIQYGNTPFWLLGFLFKIPSLIRWYRKEQSLTQEIVKKYRPDVMISDNRYGVFSPDTESIVLTHQIHLRASVLSPVVNCFIRKLLARFDQCWVPDYAGKQNLSGELSHGQIHKDIDLCYIGPLSRMEYRESDKIEYSWLAVVSGPEPQRTRFEEQVIGFFEKQREPCCLVRGVTKQATKLTCSEHINVIDFADSKKLNHLIVNSDNILCRSGYSSLMDMWRLKKSAYIIPTPGQPEQKYLWQYHRNNFFRCGLNLLDRT